MNDPSLGNKVQVLKIVVEAIRKYIFMNQCKNKSRKKYLKRDIINI